MRDLSRPPGPWKSPVSDLDTVSVIVFDADSKTRFKTNFSVRFNYRFKNRFRIAISIPVSNTGISASFPRIEFRSRKMLVSGRLERGG